MKAINDTTEITETTEFTPSPIQAKFARIYLDTSQRRTHEVIAKELSIHRNTIGNWLKNPEFSKWLSSRRFEILDGSLVDIYKTLCHKARSGDFNSMKLVLEMAGCYTPGMRVESTGAKEQILIEVISNTTQIQQPDSKETGKDK